MAKNAAYRQAEQKIAAARQSGEKALDLSVVWGAEDTEKLSELPESLARLTWLQSLNLRNNRLTALPESLGQLSQLQSLDLSCNALAALPESLGQLSQLQSLDISRNRLASLPESTSQLSKLRRLSFSLNRIASFPDWLCGLPNLADLYANGNKLKTLPVSLADMDQLKRLALDGNPLEPELAAAYDEGLDSVKRYLRELAKGARKRYEAKLLILGDGNEGKTCVSRALRGLPFCQQNTTHALRVNISETPPPD